MIRRHLFTFVAGVSLLTCFAAGVLWTRSMSTCDRILRVSKWTFVDVISLRGQVRVQFVIADQQIPLLPVWDRQSLPTKSVHLRDNPRWRIAGFGGSHGPIRVTNGTATSYIAVVPNWAMMICAGMLAVMMYQLAKWQHRAEAVKRGTCKSCGYNLTGNVSGVCPECGTRIASAPAHKRDAHAARCG